MFNYCFLNFFYFTGDFLLESSFLNFSNYCILSYLHSFFLEICLFIYIIYHIIFFKENRSTYIFYYLQYLVFLILLLISFFFLFFCNYSLITLHLISNVYSYFAKISALIVLMLILIISTKKFLSSPHLVSLNELPCILTFLLLFIFVLFSSYDLFIMYLSIEGISLIVYTLGSIMNQSLINLEAIIKYFLVNNMASSLLLWSISYIYILIGTTDCFELQYFLISNLELITTRNLYFAIFLFILSITFKLAIFPFQWWIADVFEGLWTPVTFIYAVLIKLTFFLFFFKLLWSVFHTILFFFQPFFWLAALGSIIYGSLGALIQVKIKRFLAYTSITQSGYIIMGVACNSTYGFVGSLLYLVMYCFITIIFFCILLNTENIITKKNLTYLNELYSMFLYNKEISLHLIFILLVMAAIPPFSSFFVKLFIFMGSIEAKGEFITMLVLAFTLVSTFYYLNFIQQLVFLKYKHKKIFLFFETPINKILIRLNSFFFFFSYFILPSIYTKATLLIYYCILPLTLSV